MPVSPNRRVYGHRRSTAASRARTFRPAIMPSRPDPMTSCTSSGICRRRPLLVAADTMAAATTCCEACSREPASRKTSSALSPGAVSMAMSRAPPTVSVPVLSKRTVCVRAKASRAAPPLMRIPRRAACETPAMNATGAARMRGHGVATTKTASPRIGSPVRNHAPPATRSRHWEQEQRVAICKTNKRRLSRLSSGYQSHDAGIGAFAGRGCRLH